MREDGMRSHNEKVFAPFKRSPIMRILLVENHTIFAHIVVQQFLSDHEVVIAASITEEMRQLSDHAPFDAALREQERVTVVRAREPGDHLAHVAGEVLEG